jgi:thiol-disulfide isomerase/thioredoxin
MDGGARMLSIGVTAGLIALVVALVAASALGLAMRRRSGRFRPGSATVVPATVVTVNPAAPVNPEVLTEDDLGGPLGRQATLVQFSTAFCAPCRPTRLLLAQVAGLVDGVSHVEVDAATRLDLVRRLRISSTPTVLVLDQRGAIVKRASGLPRKADVIAALGAVASVPAGE